LRLLTREQRRRMHLAPITVTVTVVVNSSSMRAECTGMNIGQRVALPISALAFVDLVKLLELSNNAVEIVLLGWRRLLRTRCVPLARCWVYFRPIRTIRRKNCGRSRGQYGRRMYARRVNQRQTDGALLGHQTRVHGEACLWRVRQLTAHHV
jgi:hypothetical protein